MILHLVEALPSTVVGCELGSGFSDSQLALATVDGFQLHRPIDHLAGLSRPDVLPHHCLPSQLEG